MCIQITLCICNLLLCNCKAPKPAIKILLLTFYICGQNPDLIKFGLEPRFVLHSVVMFTTIHVQYTLFPLKMLSFSQHTNVWFTFKIITLHLCKTPVTTEGEIAQQGESIVFKNNIASREHILYRLDRVLPKYFRGSFKNTCTKWTSEQLFLSLNSDPLYKYHITHSLLFMPLGSQGHKL